MTDYKRLNDFVELVIGLNAPALNVFGEDLPGNAGISESQEGAINSGMDVTYELKKKVIEFAEAYKSSAPKEDVERLAKEVEGFLLDEQLVNVLNESQVNKLVSELDIIMEQLGAKL